MIIPILQITQAKGAGEAVLRRLLSILVASDDKTVFELCGSVQSLVAEIGVKEDIAENIVAARETAEKLAEDLENQAVEVVWLGSQGYPERLARILRNDAPPVLFVRGNRDLLNAPTVGFCGSRKASNKGLCVTEGCARQFATDGTCVISGYAHGVDMAAHRAAIKNGGTTIIVLVEGILRFQRKRDIADLLTEENHLLVSQFPPMLIWSGRNAMKRNRTIIGLSDAMILVESGLTGGTFAAGEETLKRQRPLFVIDFAQPGPSAEANPHFIQQGGVPIRGNREGIPNVDQVKAVVREQSWRNIPLDEPTLFNWNQTESKRPH